MKLDQVRQVWHIFTPLGNFLFSALYLFSTYVMFIQTFCYVYTLYMLCLYTSYVIFIHLICYVYNVYAHNILWLYSMPYVMFIHTIGCLYTPYVMFKHTIGYVYTYRRLYVMLIHTIYYVNTHHMLCFSASPFIHTIYSSHADGHPSLTLICNTTQSAHQSIESTSFRWSLPDGSARYGRILVIDNVTLQHSGKYVCITKQTIDGEKMSASSSTLITAGNNYHLASSQQNLSSRFPTKQVSNQSPQLQRLARKLKFYL